MPRRVVHLLQIAMVILCSALTIGGCDDPPEPVPIGGIVLMMRTFGATEDPSLTAIDHITLQTDHVQVVHTDAAGNESLVTVDTANRLLTLNNQEQTQFLAQYPIPVGSVSQIRVFPKEATIALKDGSTVQLTSNPQTPSFDQSGWKIVPEKGEAWPINDNLLTGVRALFHFDKEVLFNKGVGYKVKPTVPAETFDVNPAEDKPGVFVDRILVAVHGGVSRRQVDAINAEIGATILRAPNLSTAYVMKLPPTKNLEDAFTFYRAKPEVAWCFADMNVAPNDYVPNEGIQDTQALAKLPAAWEHLVSSGLGIGDRSIVIAVLDSGIDIAHPDIAFNIAINQGEIPDELTVVDVDNDGIITFFDLNSSDNVGVRPFDINGNGYADGVDLLDDPRWANKKDEDENCKGVNAQAQPCVDDLIGWSTDTNIWNRYVAPQIDSLDKSYHGTFVAGIIGAEGNNGPGSQAFGIAGALWRLQIVPIRIDAGGEDVVANGQSIIEAMVYASRRGAHIANISYGSLLVSDAANTSCIKDLTGLVKANQAGIPQAQFMNSVQGQPNLFLTPDLVGTQTLFVMAAGNDAANLADPQIFSFPGEAAQVALGKKVLIVGATESDEPTMADFSNYGAPVVEIFAPGTDWKSLTPWISGENCEPANDGDCTEYGSPGFRPKGTSFAAPLVAGVAGLALIAFPQLLGDPAALRDHIVRTATRSVSESVECSPQQDQPLVNAHAAVTDTP